MFQGADLHLFQKALRKEDSRAADEHKWTRLHRCTPVEGCDHMLEVFVELNDSRKRLRFGKLLCKIQQRLTKDSCRGLEM